LTFESSFHTYRKEIPFGTYGWLTASLSARDWNKDGVIENEPTLQIDTLAGNNRHVLTMKVPDYSEQKDPVPDHKQYSGIKQQRSAHNIRSSSCRKMGAV
jgi:hypothetical protein